MAKKNTTPDYTPVTHKIGDLFNLLLKLKEIILAISAVFLWFLGLWLANKLNPLIQNIDHLANRVNATESRTHNLEKDITEIKQDTSYIRGVLDAKK